MTKPAAKKPTKPPAKANNAAKGNARSTKTTTKAPGKKKPTPPPPVANAKAKAKGAAATAAKSKGTPSDGAQRKATARSPDDEVHPSAKPVGTAATVVAAVKKALETSAAVNTAAPLKSTAKKHAKPTPIVNVDDVIVSRSNRERRPMQFFESGNDAMNSSATECSRPVEPAPTTPFKPAKAHSIKEKAEAPTAPVTRNNVKPDTGKAALVARPPEDGATRTPHPPPASPPHKKSKSEPVKAKGSKGGVAKGATVVPEQPALQTRPQPNATPTRRPPLSDDRDDTSCPPPPPKLPVHARPTAVANDTCRRRLEYDDDDNNKHNENQPPPTPSVVETIAKASTLTKHAKVAAAPPPAPTVVVTAFVDQYVDRFGVGFSLGHMDSEHVTKPHVATGFLFTDGSSAVIDAVGNLTYVNAHRHRFTIRNVTGKITIPERLQKKMQVLVCMRAAITAYFSTDPASPRDAVSAAPEVHRADPTWTCWERDLLPCAPGHLVDDQTSPVYCCSAPVAAHLRKAADGVAVDDHVHVTPRQFVLSQRSAPYPGKTYYCSDGTADVD